MSSREPMLPAPRRMTSTWGSSPGALIDDAVKDENVGLYGMGDAFEPLARVELRAIVPGGAMSVGVLGIGEWSMRVGAHEASASLSASTDDVGEAVLRPPGWLTDVLLDGPTELVAEVVPTHSGGHGALGLIAEPRPSSDDDAIAAAAAAAAAADIAVVVVGLTEEQETETVDKTTLALRAGRTSWSRLSRPLQPEPSSSSTRPPRC